MTLTLNINRSKWQAADVEQLVRNLNNADISWSYRRADTYGIDGIKIIYNRDEGLARIIYFKNIPKHINPREEIDMNANKKTLISDAEAQVARAIADLERAQANLAEAQKPKAPAEPAANTIRFSLRHEAGGTKYDYAARRAGARWFTTGSTCPRNGYSWAELVEFIREPAWHSDIVPMIPDNAENISV